MPSKYRRLISLMRNEWRSPEALAAMQNAKLRRLVDHAYTNVPFYRRLFREAGAVPADIRNAADLVRLPVIDKSMLRVRPVEDIVDRRMRPEQLIERYTSGSTGAPFRFFVDAAFDAQCKAQYLRPYLTNGRGLFDRVLRFSSHGPVPDTWFQKLGLLREIKVACDRPPDALLTSFVETAADIVEGYPSTLLALSSAIERTNPEFKKPKLVFSDSELLTEAVRTSIQANIGAPVLDVFGTFETDNIAYECNKRSGYHVAIDCVVAEIVAADKPVEPGERGELVCTVLDNYAMPFIRYKLGDIATALPTPCKCGRGLPLMNVAWGRTRDCVVRGDGTMEAPIEFTAGIDRIIEFAFQYQIAQTGYDSFRIALVPRRSLEARDRALIETLVRKRYPGATVTIAEVDEIPREASGKSRIFVCEL
ncbi:MAG TPA: hypothetical protein VGC50_05410 [Gammaproteobacteria bacterium]